MWVQRPGQRDDGAAADLARQLRLPLPLCRLLVGRGILDVDAARRFLRPRLDGLDGAGRLADLDRALDRIGRAIDGGETILVHGDYDVDGMAATALLTRVLRRLGGRAVPFAPHRTRDGYDLGLGGVRAAAEAGASLIVTADCGIVAHEGVAAARDSGIDVVVSDHHTPGDRLPDAVAVLNPNRPDCGYGNKDLCGAGVAFKMAWALARSRGVPDEELLYHLDLVALATIADLVPLVGENRTLVHFGMRVLRDSRKPGVRALLKAAGLAGRDSLSAGQVSHVLAPRLNAVGRIDDAQQGVRLLMTEDEAEADRIAAVLEERNRERQVVDREILDQVLDRLEREYSPEERIVVLEGEAWHPGVIGIVASRVVDRIHRPAVLIALGETDRARGSARSIPGFDLFGAIRDCAAHLERFGGHKAAAGFDIRRDRIPAFREMLRHRARALLPDEPVQEVRIDQELRLEEVTAELFRYIRYLGPFGVGNPTPVLVVRGVEPRDARIVGEGHLKLRLVDGRTRLEAIGFRKAEALGELLGGGGPVDVAFQLHEDHFRGRVRWQAKLVDARPAE